LINPELLVWARETAKYDTTRAAKKLAIAVDKLERWELGEDQPTINQLRKIANIYKRPLAVFYLSEKPKDFQPLKEFRRVDIYFLSDDETKLTFEIRKAVSRRSVALELVEDLHDDIPAFNHRIKLSDDPESVALKIRKFLYIDYEKQTGFLDSNTAFNSWVSAVERSGVLVFQASGIDVESMRGFSICEHPLPIIGLNIRDALSARIFSLIHELTHIMLNKSGICDIIESGIYDRRIEGIEKFCNHVAGSTLIPKETLLTEQLVKENNDAEWSDIVLRKLANKFKCSREVVLRRFLTFELTTPEFYNKKREQFLEEYRRDEEDDKKKEGGYAPFPRRVISTSGLSFVNLVLEGYHTQAVTLPELSDCLNMKLKHLPSLEHEALSKSAKYEVLF